MYIIKLLSRRKAYLRWNFNSVRSLGTINCTKSLRIYEKLAIWRANVEKFKYLTTLSFSQADRTEFIERTASINALVERLD